MAVQYIGGDVNPVIAPVATAIAVALGDLVYTNSGSVESASSLTWDTDLATTQETFVDTFLGVALQRKVADVARIYGNSADNEIVVARTGVFEFDTASASYAVGALVGPAKQSGDLLENQKVAAVANETLNIGRVAKKTTSATRVQVMISSNLMSQGREAS